MTIVLNVTILFATVVAMEGIANVTHRFVMHGFGWNWHRSHHEPRVGRWEKNDLYALVFAALSIGLFAVDDLGFGVLFWIGLGMMFYGVLYALLHDALVHRRFRIPFEPRSPYLKRLIQAHRIHHAVIDRDGAVSFGFLYAAPPAALARALRESRLAQRGSAETGS